MLLRYDVMTIDPTSNVTVKTLNKIICLMLGIIIFFYLGMASEKIV